MLFTTNQIVDNVWIGAKYVNSQYKWLNGVNLNYTNWAEGYPKNITDDCVQMSSDPGSVGKWVDTSCKKKNIVVCEKLPNWSISHIQQTVLSLMDSFEKSELIHKQTETSLLDKITTLEKDKIQSDLIHKQTEASIMDKVSAIEKSELIHKQTEENLQETISNLKQNIIPVGFIYVQFPNEKIPHDIWSWMTWQEITSSYAGLFFRAFGGNSGSFGSTQEASSPGITKVQTEALSAHSSAGNTFGLVNMTEGEWSNWIGTAGLSGVWSDIRFFTEKSEVRPRNTAIRIWKRYA